MERRPWILASLSAILLASVLCAAEKLTNLSGIWLLSKTDFAYQPPITSGAAMPGGRGAYPVPEVEGFQAA